MNRENVATILLIISAIMATVWSLVSEVTKEPEWVLLSITLVCAGAAYFIVPKSY